MDEVETAAADTTSDHSSPYHHHRDPHHTSSCQSDLLLPSLPSLSKQPPPPPHYMYNEGSEEPYPKRPRTSEPFDFTSSTTDTQNRMFGILEEPPPGHHDPGSAGFVRSQKPVGIAQPFRMQESPSNLKQIQGDEIEEDLKQKSTWRSDFDPPGDTGKLPMSSKLVATSPEDEQYDSDKSQGRRFSKFTNESKVEPDQKVQLGETGLMESDTESESVSNFEYPFAPPSSESIEGESSNENDNTIVEKVMQSRTNKGTGGNVNQLSREWQPALPADSNIPARSSASHLQSRKGTCELPLGKLYHVFVSHSTSDEKWATESVLHPLTHIHGMTGVACCNFMHKSQYNDSDIRKAMKESCVVLIGISPAYLSSSRCDLEWQFAVQLFQQRRCRVVVAAFGKCSRPNPLRQFFYLDFIERNKLRNVWEVLLKTIKDAVSSMKPKHHPENPHFNQYQQATSVSQQQGQERTQITATEEPPHFQQQGNLSDLGNTSQEDYDEYQQNMTAGFEQMCREMYQTEDNAQPGGEFPGPWGATEDIEPPPDQHISDPRSSKAPEGTDESAEIFKKASREGKSADVEEGEVSDSSGEVSGIVEDDQAPAQSNLVATFYNRLAEPDADKRNESPIFYMRNFNNWVKSILIRTYLSLLPHGSTVLDLCCGKGGDLLKWKEGGIVYLVCADISEASVEACESRLHSPKMINKQTRKLPFEAEFIVADCCEVRLRDMYKNPARRFNLASCQFSVHYSFESYEKAHMMLRNASENLRRGGYFIGTTIDSNQLVHRLRRAGQQEDGTWTIGNDIFTVTLDPSLDPYNLPLFGARYNFKLHGVVDLPEFLVHFPLLVSMLKDFDMELKLQQNFYDFFSERRYNTEDIYLMNRMKAFNLQTGTMSTAEWEAVGLYLVYVFQKK